MRLSFTERAWEQYLYWQAHDRATHAVLKGLDRLLDDVVRSPLAGLGKPEPLRDLASDLWSRRITEEHRLVCLVDDHEIVVVQARFHY